MTQPELEIIPESHVNSVAMLGKNKGQRLGAGLEQLSTDDSLHMAIENAYAPSIRVESVNVAQLSDSTFLERQSSHNSKL